MKKYLAPLLAACIVISSDGISLAQTPQTAPAPQPGRRAPRPTQPQIDAVSAALRAKDVPAQDAAVKQINDWLDANQLLVEVWSTWMPALKNAGRQQDVADLSWKTMTGPINQPATDAIGTVVAFRANALIALNKPDEALKAAKMYYNVCEFKNTPKAIDMIGLCLAKLHPEDGEIVRRFRNEQAKASAAVGPDSALTEKVDPSPTLAAIKIDAAPFDDATVRFAARPAFADQAIYANLLLMADKGADGEKVYRQLYQLAGNDAEIKLATEGVARALRAADGNIARANAWLITSAKSH